MLNSLGIGLIVVSIILLFNLAIFSLSPVILKKIVTFFSGKKAVEK